MESLSSGGEGHWKSSSKFERFCLGNSQGLGEGKYFIEGNRFGGNIGSGNGLAPKKCHYLPEGENSSPE